MTTITELNTKYNEISLNLEVNSEHLIARVYRISNRSRMGFKNVIHLRFKTEERMVEFLTKDVETRFAKIETKNKAKVEQKEKLEIERDSVKVGDIFVDCWGYEQTNVDAYEVVAKPSKATVVLRSIAVESIEDTSYCSDRVKPIKGNFTSGEFKKRLNGNTIKMSSFSHAFKAEEKDTFHRSWGY